MDWQFLFYSLASSGVTLAASAYILRRYFDRRLEAEFKVKEEHAKSEIKEAFRRQGAFFDDQVSILKTAGSLVYRARNAARNLKDDPESILRKTQREQLQALRAYHEALVELLYEERAIFPPEVFNHLHDMKTNLNNFLLVVEQYRVERHQGEVEVAKEMSAAIDSQFQCLSEQYQTVLSAISIHFHSPNN